MWGYSNHSKVGVSVPASHGSEVLDVEGDDYAPLRQSKRLDLLVIDTSATQVMVYVLYVKVLVETRERSARRHVLVEQ